MTFLHKDLDEYMPKSEEQKLQHQLRTITRQAAQSKKPMTFELNIALAQARGATDEQIKEAMRQHHLHHHRHLLASGATEIPLNDLSYIFNEVNGDLTVDAEVRRNGDRMEFSFKFAYSMPISALEADQ